ncbi:D-galactonate transporter [Halolamina pelagica]|uniref:D-galactonate transporter n=1 Tax=Halolamina pelagica TaxID=699431 RepID=A0A0P7GKC2_9EURY|nr:MFS transporter [Halolamina pelagica]KPN29013.1 D-galactonate transporter [Halolamina pelagica]
MATSVRDASAEAATVVGLVSGSQYVNHAYLVLFPPILATLSTEFDVSLTMLGIAIGVQGASNTVFQLPFGWLADARDRTVAFALSSVAGALGVLAVAVAPDFPTLLLGQVLIGVGVGGHHPAHYPLLSDATPDGLRGRAFSVYGVGGALGFATPPVMFNLFTNAGLTWRHAVGVVGAVGLLYALTATAVLRFVVDDDVTAANVAADGGDATDGEPIRDRAVAAIRALLNSPGILGLTLLALLTSTASWGVNTYAVVFLNGVYGVGSETANLALTGLFVVGAVAILLGGDLTDRIAPGPVMTASFAAVTGFVALLASGLVPGIVAVGALLGVGAARSLAGPARDGLTDDLSADDTVGTNFAVVSVGVMLGGAIAPPAFGYIVDATGPRAAFGGIAVVALVATLVTVWLTAVVAE